MPGVGGALLGQAPPAIQQETGMRRTVTTAIVAWLVTAIYYFYQYSLRSAPAVMMPQLSEAFGLSTMGVASMVGLFYYGYSPFSLVAGVGDGSPRAAPGRADRRRGGRHRRAAVCDRQQRGRERRPPAAGRRRRVRAGRRRVHRDDQLPRLARRDAHRRDPDVRHGRRLRRPVRRRPDDRVGRSWSTFWAGMGLAGLAISVLLFTLLPAAKPAERRADWIKPAAPRW